MKKIYRVQQFSIRISEFDVVKESKHTYWYYNFNKTKLLSERKNTSENKHFETLKEAEKYLIKICTEKVDFYKMQLEIAEKVLLEVSHL